jgi:bidirectional [NiFe] hydrogenase diaphorase subunit
MGHEDLRHIAQQERARQAQSKARIFVCTGTACQSCQSGEVLAALTEEVKHHGRKHSIAVIQGGCQGNCAEAPVVAVQPMNVLYRGVAPSDAPAIVESVNGTLVDRLLVDTSAPFFTHQMRVVTEYCGLLNPERIEDYIAVGGYTSLLDVLSRMTPAAVVQQVMRSGLRGRGGAGYPTGLKWSTVAKAPGPHKYVICNADEGDPGAYMNRRVLEE